MLDNYLNKINLLELKTKIRTFRSLARHKLSDEQLVDEIYKVLTIDNHFILFPRMRTYPIGTYFYRVRKLSSSILGENLKHESDFWNPPSHLIGSYQRLNKPQESLLYTALNIDTAMNETRLKNGDFFSLMIYENVSPVKVACIGTAFSDDMKLVEIEDFLAEEFCRPIGNGIEHFYKTSELIAKHFFDLPPEVVQDAWEYPSVQDRVKFNICFRPELGKKILKLNGSIICKNGDENSFIPYVVQDGFNDDNTPCFYEFNADLVQKIAPKFPLKFEVNPL